MLEIVAHRAAEARIGDVMRGIRCLRQVAAGDLVLALRAGLDPLQAVADRVIDRLIITHLEVQERMVLDRAPVAPEQRLRADEIDGPRDPASLALRHHQQHVVAHGLADQRIEFSIEIGAAPFARPGLHVELEIGVPGILGDGVAGELVNGDAVGQRIAAFAADGLAVPRGQCREKILECRVAVIVPVELLVGSLQESRFGEAGPFLLPREGDVH